jgi:hypothetical protein
MEPMRRLALSANQAEKVQDTATTRDINSPRWGISDELSPLSFGRKYRKKSLKNIVFWYKFPIYLIVFFEILLYCGRFKRVKNTVKYSLTAYQHGTYHAINVAVVSLYSPNTQPIKIFIAQFDGVF